MEAEEQYAQDNIDPNAPWHERMVTKHRRWIGMAIPYIFYNTIWWCLAIKHNFFANFPTHYPMSITMIFGSAIGGATSEGGGAVAFPVMTLALKIPPAIARDFSLMVQSCGISFRHLFSFLKLPLTNYLNLAEKIGLDQPKRPNCMGTPKVSGDERTVRTRFSTTYHFYYVTTLLPRTCIRSILQSYLMVLNLK